MPHGVCEKPQRRTASAFITDERFRGALPLTKPRPYARRTMLMPQYMASRRECSLPAAVVAPAHDDATAASAAASEACGAAPDGAAKPRTNAVRVTASTMRGRRSDAHSRRILRLPAAKFTFRFVFRTNIGRKMERSRLPGGLGDLVQ